MASCCTHLSPQGPFTKPCPPQLALRLHQGLGLAVTHPHPPVSEQDSEWDTWPAEATRSPVPHDLSSPLRRPHGIWVQRKGLSLLLAGGKGAELPLRQGEAEREKLGWGGCQLYVQGGALRPEARGSSQPHGLSPTPRVFKDPTQKGSPAKRS